MIILPAVTPATSAVLRVLRRAIIAAWKRVGAVLRALRHRREISKLAELDDHQLKDMGLTRSDVNGALAVSMLHDPSHVLCDIAGAGHSHVARAASLGVRRPVVITQVPKEA